MKRRVILTLLSLGAVLVCCFLYAALIVPTVIFPPLSIAGISNPTNINTGTTARIKELSSQYLDLIAPLFPDKNDWRRKQPRMIMPNDGGGIFLFKGEPKMSAGRKDLTLSSCTAIFPSTDPNLSEQERFRRAFVIETNNQATIYFKNPFSLDGLPSLADFDKGELTGEVQIRSEMEETGDEDDFFLSTRDVSFTSAQILANNKVFFHFGPYHGEGEGLRIEFAPIDRNSEAPNESSNESSAEGNAPEKENPYRVLAREGNIGGGFSIEWFSLLKLDELQLKIDGSLEGGSALLAGNSNHTASEPAEGGEADSSTTIEISCKNGVLFAPNPDEPSGWVGRFLEDVQASLIHTSSIDHFTCQNLYLYLTDPEMEEKLKKIAETYTGPKPKRMPSGQIDRLIPRLIKGVRADDAPANIEWSAEEISVFGDEVVYDIPARRIQLSSKSDAEPVRLIRRNTEVEAGVIDYIAGENGKFGKLAAGRSGRMTTLLTDGDKTSPFSMAWKSGLRIDPDEADPNLIRMALSGDIQIGLEPFGQISAKEADFWAVLPGNGQSDETPELAQMRPRSAQFRGAIQMHSNQRVCRLKDELTIRFQETGPLSAESAAPAGSTGGMAAEMTAGIAGAGPGMPNTETSPAGSLFGENQNSAIQIDGGRLDLWVRYDADRRSEISRMVIRQNLKVVETDAAGKETLRIEGDDAQIDRPSSDQAAVELVGRPAAFQGQGLNLSGYNIQVDRAKNQFSVVGRGNLTFIPNGSLAAITGSEPAHPADSSAGNSPIESLPVDVHWSQAMTFDGQTLIFQGDDQEPVLVQQKPAMELHSTVIQFKLRQPIQIFELGAAQKGKLEVALSECFGSRARPIEIISYGPIPGQSGSGGYFRGQVVNLRFENLTGAIHADGPGWIRGTGQTPKSADASNQDASNSDTSHSDASNPISTVSYPWTHLHLTFSQGLEGNAQSGIITASGDVASVAAGSNQPEMVLDAGNRETFPPDAFFLSCNSLSLSRSSDAVDSKGFDMTAEGNALFRYDVFIGRGEKIKYSDAKKNVILEGDGLNSAGIHRQTAPGAPVQSNRFSRGIFNLETKKIEADISNTTLDVLPN